MRIAITIAVFLFLLTYQPGKYLYLTPSVKHYINQISTLPSETVACLQYTEVGGKLLVYGYYIPQTHRIKKKTVRAKPCPQETIPFHNHPYQHLQDKDLQDYYKSSTGKELTEPNQMVYLSRPDMNLTVLGKYKYIMVGSNGQWAWWKRDQVVRSVKKGERLLRPKPHQSTLPIHYEIR